MSRFTAHSVAREGETLIALQDTATGAVAHVWPSLGANCIDARLAVGGAPNGTPSPTAAQGSTVDVLLAPPSLAALRAEPSHWGIPLLFPFPSLVPRGEYVFEGIQHTFRKAFHGFVINRDWQVAAIRSDDTTAEVTCTFDSSDHADTPDDYPFPFRLAARYRLDALALALTFQVTNTGAGNLPFGYGAHPYFRLPLGEDGDPAACTVHVPAARRWDLPRVASVSDGAIERGADLAPPVTAEMDLRTPTALQGHTFNGVYTGLSPVDGHVQCSVRDPHSGLEAVMRATPNHTNINFYTPAWAPAVCFEPWTCPPNVFNLAAHEIPDHGLIVLPAGVTWEGTMWLSVRRAM